MKCLMCESFSLTHICSQCQKKFLQPSLFKTQLSNGIVVYSFYKYEDIEELLLSKHTDLGFYIYKILVKNSLELFAKELKLDFKVVSLGVDDIPSPDYSHTAILNNALKSSSIKPLFGKLRAQNKISYSGKSKQFRLQNPREFVLKQFKYKEVIVVDDIITTGTTLLEATNLLQKEQKEVLFCLTLAKV